MPGWDLVRGRQGPSRSGCFRGGQNPMFARIRLDAHNLRGAIVRRARAWVGASTPSLFLGYSPIESSPGRAQGRTRDEVVTQAFMMVAVAEAIMANRATPVHRDQRHILHGSERRGTAREIPDAGDHPRPNAGGSGRPTPIDNVARAASIPILRTLYKHSGHLGLETHPDS